MENILAVINHWDDAEVILAEAEKLRTRFHTGLEVLVPVHDQLGELSKYLNPVSYTHLRAQRPY